MTWVILYESDEFAKKNTQATQATKLSNNPNCFESFREKDKAFSSQL